MYWENKFYSTTTTLFSIFETPPSSIFVIWQTNKQRFSSPVHACSENVIGPFQTRSLQTNEKLVKKMSKT